jgi:hypothetical protein
LEAFPKLTEFWEKLIVFDFGGIGKTARVKIENEGKKRPLVHMLV